MKTTISRLRIRLSNFFRRLFKVHSPNSIGDQYYYDLADICPDGLCNTPSIEPSEDVKEPEIFDLYGYFEPIEYPSTDVNEPPTDEKNC